MWDVFVSVWFLIILAIIMDNPSPRFSSPWSALGLAWELGYTVAIPLVVFALAGRLLDQRIETSPWFLLAGIGIAVAISSVAIARKIRAICRV